MMSFRCALAAIGPSDRPFFTGKSTQAMTTASQSGPLLAPFRIDPIFVPRIWGYRDLRPWFDYPAHSGPIGEAWLTGDDCLAATGLCAGQKLSAIFSRAPEALLGPGAAPESPLLVKVIFAREKLSVQVHPDDALAQKSGFPRGKTECWYALAADPGAQVAVGIKPGTTLGQIQEKIHDGTLESSLNLLPVAPGDMFFVDAGTVHAIWPGSILLETQQNCDLTYRMFDYGRPRELHVEKSLEATRLQTRAGKVAPQQLADRTLLLDSAYFRIERIQASASYSSAALRGGAAPGLAYLFAPAGAGRISPPGPAADPGAGFTPIDLPARGIVCIPAASPSFVIEDLGGLDLIRIAAGTPQ